ncbi:MAG: hypothetical protein R6X02_25600 [Enhygromyxa sp.]
MLMLGGGRSATEGGVQPEDRPVVRNREPTAAHVETAPWSLMVIDGHSNGTAAPQAVHFAPCAIAGKIMAARGAFLRAM